MINTEETPESSLKRGSFVSDFLESGRKKVKTCLSTTTDNQHIEDLEYMLKSVKALVKIIDEIWDNCRCHLTSSKDDDNSPFTFERVLFKEAKVEKKDRYLRITTQIASNTKDFGSPPAVPKDLSKLVSFDPPDSESESESESDILPDYKEYLEKSSILCEELLLPFLTGFKEHLENVQVFLGQIEEWLIESEVIDSFLKKTFVGPGCIEYEEKNDTHEIIILYGSYCLDVDSKMESKFDICTEEGREGLKATINYIKIYKPVTQIEVKDAGEKAVNGTYTLGGMVDDAYYYSYSGVWNGKPVTILLNREQNKKRWCLDCKDESGSFTYSYWAKGTGELPPLNGWSNHSIGEDDFRGVDPPPQILYKVDNRIVLP